MEDSGELPDPAEDFLGVIMKLLWCWAVVEEKEKRALQTQSWPGVI